MPTPFPGMDPYLEDPARHRNSGDIIPGTHNLIRLSFGFRTALLRLQDATDHRLQTLNERLVPKRPIRPTATAQVTGAKW